MVKVMAIFAHPDEGEIYVGGTAALYTQGGHPVKFVSLTNGDLGHFAMERKALAQRRYGEAMEAKRILGLADYEIWDIHDQGLEDTPETRRRVAQLIEGWGPDLVFTYYPIRGGHVDNMAAGWIVRSAAAMIEMDPLPAFLYVRDFFTVRFAYIPDIAVAIDGVWETKLKACGAHVSQVVEFHPRAAGVLEEVLASPEKQREFLYENTIPFSRVTPGHRMALETWYGLERAATVQYAEAFEVAEFGRQMTEAEVWELLPMLGA